MPYGTNEIASFIIHDYEINQMTHGNVLIKA